MSTISQPARHLEAYAAQQRHSNVRAIVAPTVCANFYLGAIVRPKLSTYIAR